MPAGAAKDELTQACMSVASHDKQVSAHPLGGREQNIPDVTPRLDALRCLAWHVVAREGGADIGGRDVASDLVLQLRVDPDHLHFFCAPENGQCVVDRASGLASTVPGDEHFFANALGHRPRVGQDQDRATAFNRQTVRHVKKFGPRPIRVPLARDDKVASPGIFQNAGRNAMGIRFILAPFTDQGATLNCRHESRLHYWIAFAIVLAMFIQHHRRSARSHRYHRDGGNNREGEQMRLEALCKIQGRSEQSLNSPLVIAVHEYSFIGHGSPHGRSALAPSNGTATDHLAAKKSPLWRRPPRSHRAFAFTASDVLQLTFTLASALACRVTQIIPPTRSWPRRFR